jgi:hypothetical protein
MVWLYLISHDKWLTMATNKAVLLEQYTVIQLPESLFLTFKALLSKWILPKEALWVDSWEDC